MTRPADEAPSVDARLAPDVVIVGGGPSGLTAASALAARGIDVLVLEREAEAGGIPRHSDHPGFGLRDLRRSLSGPEYARRLVEAASSAGAEIRTEATVTGWADERSLEVTSPRGRLNVDARVVVLATGARERPRTARRIPGDRPAGVYTTGQLQSLVHLYHREVGRRAVVVGSELVSWSAVLTLREAACRTVLMTSEFERPESYLAFRVPGRTVLRVPVATRTRVTRIVGRERVEAVEVEDLDTRVRRTVECDTVVCTGDWVADHELVRLAGLDYDPGTTGPVVDTAQRTSRRGVFAIGNLLHPVDTADVAALDGRHASAQVVAFLNGGRWPDSGVRLVAGQPFRWVSPGMFRPGDPEPPRGRLSLWTNEFHRRPTVVASQAGRVIGERTTAWPAAPGRVFRVPSDLLDHVDAAGGPVTLTIRGSR